MPIQPRVRVSERVGCMCTHRMRRTRLAAQGGMRTSGVSGVAMLGVEKFFFSSFLLTRFSYSTYGIRQASYCSCLSS